MPPPPPLPAIGPPTPAGGDDPAWAELGRVALRMCGAEAAGVAAGTASPPLDRLAALAAPGDTAVIRDQAHGTWLAGAAIDPAAGDALLWVERHDPFDAATRARLGWLAIGGTDLGRVLAAEREQADLLLREIRHRCANDLHLVAGLVSHQARFADHPAVGAALDNVGGRIGMLARARQLPQGDLVSGLDACVRALTAHTEDRGIAVALRVEGRCPPIDERRAAVLLIAVNELATNAVKHAFAGAPRGRIEVVVVAAPDHVRIAIDDDGTPLPPVDATARAGSGLDLVRRLVAGVRGSFVPPAPGAGKLFTIDMPVAPATFHRRDR